MGTSPRARRGNAMRESNDAIEQYNNMVAGGYVAYNGNGGTGGAGAAVSNL